MYLTDLQLKDVERLKHYLYCFRELSEENEIKEWNYGGKKYNLTSEYGLKKLFKAHVKKQLPWVYYKEKPKPNELINHFEIFESYEKRISVYIFKNEDGIIDKIKNHMDWEATPNHYDYSPTGMFFKDEARFYEFPDRVIVTQSIVLDC